MTGRSHQEIKWNNLAASVAFTSNDRVATALHTCETEFGQQIQSVKEITSIPNQERAVLLVQLAAGLKVKLCISALADYRFETATQFTNLVKVVRFPKVILLGAGWAAFEWIEGTPVSELRFSTQIMDGAVRVLMAIHETKIEAATNMRPITLKEVGLILQKKMPLLISHGIVSNAQFHMVSDLYQSLPLEALNVSLIHGDFSPANLVVCGKDFCLVDNDKMRVHFTDYDISRASTFWEEWSLCSQRLLDVYRRQSKLRFDPASLRFWEIFDLVYRISYRISVGAELNDFCIMKLKRILTTGVPA